MVRNKLFFTPLFFILNTLIGLLFFVSFFYDFVLPIAVGVFLLFAFEIMVECILLWSYNTPIEASRIVPDRMSNNDANWVKIELKNQSPFFLKLHIREELPHQLNLRDFVIQDALKKSESRSHEYEIKPTQRGLYHFGDLNVFIRIALGVVERKKIFPNAQELKVYPSYMNLDKYDLNTLKTSNQYGIRKTRKLGHSLEFEQIKDYVYGDDIRHLNWKATAKRNNFMINQYTDEKSKEVYCLIDTGRTMKFPFKALALVDYAINSSLIILNNAIKTQDKAGLLSFNKKVEHFLKAEKRPSHIQKILEKLYAIKPEFHESDFSTLYVHLKRVISHRSLLFLFTNFENYEAFERELLYLQAINKSHVLVVVFFKNVVIEDKLQHFDIKNTIQQAIIEKQINEKKRIVSELNQRHIQTILTTPDALTIDLLNKYLEIKAKAMV